MHAGVHVRRLRINWFTPWLCRLALVSHRLGQQGLRLPGRFGK
ncbi:hypothetical protein ABIE49_007888 [Bradyrhizobium sp. OAE829]